MAIDLYTTNAYNALLDLAGLTPHKYAGVNTVPASIAEESRNGSFSGPIDIFLDLPYQTKESLQFRSVMRRLFAEFHPTEKIWRVNLDPALYDGKMMHDIISALIKAGIVIAVTPSVGYSPLSNVDLAGFPGHARVWLCTKYEERETILKNFTLAQWNESRRQWSVTIDWILSNDISKIKLIDDRRWFDGITSDDLSSNAIKCHFKSHRLTKSGPLEFHALCNDKQHSVFQIIRTADTDFVYVKQGFFGNGSVLWLDSQIRQVPSEIARNSWNRLVASGFSTTAMNANVIGDLATEKTANTREIQHAKAAYATAHSMIPSNGSTANYALQA